MAILCSFAHLLILSHILNRSYCPLYIFDAVSTDSRIRQLRQHEGILIILSDISAILYSQQCAQTPQNHFSTILQVENRSMGLGQISQRDLGFKDTGRYAVET